METGLTGPELKLNGRHDQSRKTNEARITRLIDSLGIIEGSTVRYEMFAERSPSVGTVDRIDRYTNGVICMLLINGSPKYTRAIFSIEKIG